MDGRNQLQVDLITRRNAAQNNEWRNTMRRIFASLFAALAVACAGSAASYAQDAFPSKPIKIVVPFKAGGGMDVSTRFV